MQPTNSGFFFCRFFAQSKQLTFSPMDSDMKHLCNFPGCAKSFKRKDYLQRHSSTHSNIRPFNCTICKCSFTRKDLLDKHRRSKSHRNKHFKSEGRSIFINSFENGTQQQMESSSAGELDDKFTNFTTSGFEESMNWIFGQNSPVISPNFESILQDYSYPAEADNSKSAKLVSYVSSNTISKLLELLKTLNIEADFQSFFKHTDEFLDLFWHSFDTMYPIIHRPTFDVCYSNPNPTVLNLLLLITIVVIGSSFAKQEPEFHLVANELQSKVRSQLILELQKIKEMRNAPLELLQALSLTDYFSLYSGTIKNLFEFQIYHPLIINLIKEIGLYSEQGDPLESKETTYETYQDWISYESWKRVAFFEYLLDIQRYFFLGTNPCLSVFDVKINLPCTDSTWYAIDTEGFKNEYSKQPKELNARSNSLSTFENVQTRYDQNEQNKLNIIPEVTQEGSWPNFLWSLRRLMQPYSNNQKEYHVDCFSQFSRFIFLHGVLSLVKELRNVHSFGQEVLSKSQFFAAKIEQSFYSWRLYLHHNIKEANASTTSSSCSASLNNYEISPAFWANITMFNVGLLGLYCKFDQLIGLFKELKLGSTNSFTIEAAISWSKSKDGEHSLIQACRLLRTMVDNKELIDAVPQAVFSIYISIVVCWVYEFGMLPDLKLWKDVTILSDVLNHHEKSLNYLDLILESKNCEIVTTDRFELLKYHMLYVTNYLKPCIWKHSSWASYVEEIESMTT